MRLIVATFILAPLLAFCQSMTTPGVGQLPQKFDTIAQLVSRPGTNYQMVVVRGWRSAGDWGAERQAKFIPGAVVSTNLGCDFAATNNVGTWHFPDCESGEVDARWFSVVGNGTTDDTTALQAAIDWAAERSTTLVGAPYPDALGGTILLPDSSVFLHSGLTLKRGIRIAGRTPAGKQYPGDQNVPRFKLVPSASSPSFFAGVYTNHLGVWDVARMVTLKNFVIDGSYDDQNPDNFALHGIEVNGGPSLAVKNWVIEGVAIVDHVGYSIYAMGGPGSSSIEDCYLGNGIFTAGLADCKISSCDLTGRTRGLQSLTDLDVQPFPAIWMGPYTVANKVIDCYVYCGPTFASGRTNSIRKWAISSYNDGTDELTLSTTNGLHLGMPVVWRSSGILPVNIVSNNTYWVGSLNGSTVKLSTFAQFVADPRTFSNLGAGTNASDVIQFGDAAMIYMNGGSSTAKNDFTGIRAEDSFAHVQLMDGVWLNSFANCMYGYSYTNTGRFVLLRNGARANKWTGGVFYRAYPTNPKGAVPDVIFECEDGTWENRVTGAYMGGAVTNFYDSYTLQTNITGYANHSDHQTPTFNEAMGNQRIFTFRDVYPARTNHWVWDAHNWFFVRTNYASYSTHYDLAHLQSSERLEIWGETTPSFGAFGFGVNASPRLDFNVKGGERDTGVNVLAARTPAFATLGSIFWSGHDGTNTTSARSAIYSAAAGWADDANPTGIGFEVTDYNKTERREVLYIDPAGNLNWTNTAPQLNVRATNGISGLRINILGDVTNTAFRINQQGSGGVQTNLLTIPNGGGLQMPEVPAAPSTPAANNAITYMSDDGSGKTVFVAKWSDGSTNIIAPVSLELTFTNGLTNSARVISWAADPGSNITFVTNNGRITIEATAATGSTNGTSVSVNGGPLLVYANLLNSPEISVVASGTNTSFNLNDVSVETNRFTTNAFIYFLNRSNHLATQPWTTIDTTPTTLGGYGIVDAQFTNTTLTRLGGIGPGVSGDIIYRDATGWTNLAKSTDGLYLKLVSGFPAWASVGTAHDSYIAKSSTYVSISNTVDESSIYTWAIPANTLDSDGDELEFYIPAKYITYNGQVSGYSYEFAIDDDTAAEEYINGIFASAIASVSSSFAMDWNVRVKRVTETTAVVIVKHVAGADGPTDTSNAITHSRYLEHTMNVGWNDIVNFELRITLGDANVSHGIVAFGSTVRMLQ